MTSTVNVTRVLLEAGRFGRSLRDPRALAESSIDLPELGNFVAWAKLPPLAGVTLWVPLEAERDHVQLARSPDTALVAVAYGSAIACVDLRRCEVVRFVQFVGGEVTDLVPTTGRTVLALFQSGVAEFSLTEGVVWTRYVPDHIADYRLEGETLALELEGGQSLSIDMPHERCLAAAGAAKPGAPGESGAAHRPGRDGA